jgi:hypothetical protein
VWPDSQLVANGYYWVDYDVDPATGAEIPVTLTQKALREGKAADFYIDLFGHNANEQVRVKEKSMADNYIAWSWVPWYSRHSAEGVEYVSGEPKDNSDYDDSDKAYWEQASQVPGNPGSGEGNLLVAHSQESGERAPLSADRRSFGSITFLFATPAQYGPFGGKAMGNLRANMVYRLYAGSTFNYTKDGIQGFRSGPIHTRMDFNAEKVFGNPSGVNVALAVEVYNLFNQKDNRQNALSGRAVDFNTNYFQQYGIMGLEPTNNSIETLRLENAEVNDIGNYWDRPREMTFSMRIKW